MFGGVLFEKPVIEFRSSGPVGQVGQKISYDPLERA